MSKLAVFFALCALALVGHALAEEDASTMINFNFEGMIPTNAGSGASSLKHHQLNYFEKSTTDVADTGFGTNETIAKPTIWTVVWANLLWNQAQTATIGHDIGTCVATPPKNNQGPLFQFCQVVHYFNNDEDQLVIIGATTFDSVPQRVNVVGGSGKYLGATGSCTYQPFPNYDVQYVCDIYTPN